MPGRGTDTRLGAMTATEQAATDHAGPSTPRDRPDLGLTRWFVDTLAFATPQTTTAGAYADYLAHCQGPPLPRARFVADLRLLGVRETGAETSLLVRG